MNPFLSYYLSFFKGGRVAIVGSRGTVEINPRDLMSREAQILGVMLLGLSSEEQAEIYAAVQAGLESNALLPVVGPVFEFDQVEQSHEHVIVQPGGSKGKVVLHIQDIDE